MPTIPVYHKKHIVAFTKVDQLTYNKQRVFRWHLGATGYVVRSKRVNGKLITYYLHREILGLVHGDKRQADHIDRDKLNNYPRNLRIVTDAQNKQNVPGRVLTSKHRGVCWVSREKRWRATVRLNYKSHTLGYFNNEQKAAEAVKEWRKEHMPYSTEQDNGE